MNNTMNQVPHLQELSETELESVAGGRIVLPGRRFDFDKLIAAQGFEAAPLTDVRQIIAIPSLSFVFPRK